MNRLSREKSPYLLQHAANPVDWYPWGEEAFAAARAGDKPIFLSVGYSTCHWCHVMERESFENAEVAALLNAHFVAIKVDREERPDVDRVYMTFVQATTGSGGWPMSVWLTPDLQPFYGGTYFPPTSRWGRPGFAEVLGEIARLWRDERGELGRQAAQLTARLQVVARPDGAGPAPDRAALERAVADLAGAFDARDGGFGGAPKFPRPAELLFLLREHARTGDARALEMAATTLTAMAAGGMRDHVGGGFHRYSVDAMWRVPHFEKMLYDQAQLTLAYLEAGQAREDCVLLEVAADTLAYVQRDLTDPAGGFYSAEDADSVPPESLPVAPEAGGLVTPEPGGESRGDSGLVTPKPGGESRGDSGVVTPKPGGHGESRPAKAEGAFYVWTDREIADLLEADAELFRMRFGILPGGNAPHDPQGEFTGKNLLYLACHLDDLASRTGRPHEDVVAALERARRVLFEARNRRPRPHVDDKVLTAWNGLMIAAFARAARVLETVPERGVFAMSCLRWAQRAAAFLRDVMWRPDGRLLRRYRNGEASIDGYAEDYASLIFGLLELFQADGDPGWLEWALTLQERQDALFLDREGGGWFSTTGTDPSVLLRLKEDYDGAEPAASSLSTWNLLVLAHLTGKPAYHETLDRVFRSFGRRLTTMSRAVPMMLAALSIREARVRQVVIIGHPGRPDTQVFERALESGYHPFVIRIPVDPVRQSTLARLLPFVEAMRMRGGRATAYVCRDFTCEAPTTDAAEMVRQLEGGRD